MANAKEETAQIMLSKDYTKPVELVYHPHVIQAVPGKVVTVTEKEARFWIGTGKFERVEKVESASLDQLMKSTKDQLIIIATDAGIAPEESQALKKQDLAQLILTKWEEK